MKNKAFTLIELLVVVLIIGILAAIAVPQYQKAVEKSRASEAFLLLKSLKDAKDVYSLSHPNGAIPTLAELDINIPGEEVSPIVGTGNGPFHQNQYFQIGILRSTYGNPHAFRVSNNKLLYALAYYEPAKGYYCNVMAGADKKYSYVCKALGGVSDTECAPGVIEEDNDVCFKLP